MSKFVVAVNARGVKQTIPAHWLDHPTLGAGFRLPRSRRRQQPVEPEPIEAPTGDVPEQG